MSGAGAVDVAFGKTDSFLGALTGAPDYFEPFKNPTIQDLTLDRALERQRMPGQVWADQSVAGNMEGAFAIQGTLDDSRIDDIHDIVFNASSPYTITTGLAAASRWFITAEYIDGGSTSIDERVLKGCVPIDYTVEYTQGGSIRITIAFIYADEESNTAKTPTGVADANGTSGRWHGFDFDFDGVVQAKEASATLSLTNLSQFQRGSQKLPVDAVNGPAEATMEITSIFSETTQQEYAYGESTQTTTSVTMDDATGTMTLSAAGTTVATYTLAKCKVGDYAWTDILSGEGLREQVSFNVDGAPAVEVA